MKTIVGSTTAALSLLLLFSTCPASAQPGYALLHSFAGQPSDGDKPAGRFLVTAGRMYGVTTAGGASDFGTLFSLAPSGSGYTIWYNFGSQIMDADGPQGTLVSDGETLYGVTEYGGTFDMGTVFSFIPGASALPILFEFKGVAFNDGENPKGGLLLEGGTLYGTTSKGGADNKGVIFSIPTDLSTPNILHRFNGTDGDQPVGSLVSDGTRLYGVTTDGGGQPDPASGVLFSIGKDGSGFTVLHRFIGSPNDGVLPQDGLILSEGKLYGTTFSGGSVGVPPGYGTVFSINTDGTGCTVLHNLQGGNEGAGPFGGLLADGSRLYGTCPYLGQFNRGALFSLHSDGSEFTVLHQFKGMSDPMDPDGSGPLMALATDGSKIFGTTMIGGTGDKGTVYSLDLPAQPLRLTLNRTTLHAGEHLIVDVLVQPIAQPFDAWAVILGTSASYSMVFGRPGEVQSGTHPLVTGIGELASAYSGRLLDLAIPTGAAGTYQVIVGLVPAGTAPTGVGSCIAGYVDQRTVTVR